MYTATASIMISATTTKVWSALTDPSIIKQCFWGAEITSDWNIGSFFFFKGEVEGVAYEGKGTILDMKPDELLEVSYWSTSFDLPDLPEYYKRVTCRLMPEDLGTWVTIEEDNNPSEESRDASHQRWTSMLKNLKHLLETVEVF